MGQINAKNFKWPTKIFPFVCENLSLWNKQYVP